MKDVILFISYFLFTCSGLVLIKFGSIVKNGLLLKMPIVDISLSIYSLLGIICYGISFLLYIVLVSRHDLSFLNPFTVGVTSVLIFTSAVLFFHESVTVAKLVGLLVVIIGVVILNIGK